MCNWRKLSGHQMVRHFHEVDREVGSALASSARCHSSASVDFRPMSQNTAHTRTPGIEGGARPGGRLSLVSRCRDPLTDRRNPGYRLGSAGRNAPTTRQAISSSPGAIETLPDLNCGSGQTRKARSSDRPRSLTASDGSLHTRCTRMASRRQAIGLNFRMGYPRNVRTPNSGSTAASTALLSALDSVRGPSWYVCIVRTCMNQASAH